MFTFLTGTGRSPLRSLVWLQSPGCVFHHPLVQSMKADILNQSTLWRMKLGTIWECDTTEVTEATVAAPAATSCLRHSAPARSPGLLAPAPTFTGSCPAARLRVSRTV